MKIKFEQNSFEKIVESTRLFDILLNYEKNYPEQNTALAIKRDGKWDKFTVQEYQKITDNLSYAFMKLGIEPGDKVSIIATNRPEWNILDMAITQIGAVMVPIYPTISEADYKIILNNYDSVILLNYFCNSFYYGPCKSFIVGCFNYFHRCKSGCFFVLI